MKATDNFPVLRFEPANGSLHFWMEAIQSVREITNWSDAFAHTHDYYQIIWIAKGAGTHWIDLEKNTIENNQLFCIKPGQMHRFIPDSRTEGVIISFTEAFIQVGDWEFDFTKQPGFLRLFTKPGGIIVQQALQADVAELIIRMEKEFNNRDLFQVEILRRFLKILFIYLTRQLSTSIETVIPTRSIELVERFKKLLEKNFRNQKMVAEYAALLFVTPNYLNETIKKNTGYSAGYHIRKRVVLEAKRMMVQSDNSMKEIAYNLGFIDTTHFSKFFKLYTGTNFSEFKKENVLAAVAIHE